MRKYQVTYEMQKLEQRIHICEISSFCHWLKPATLVAADCESQAWRKQRKPIQNLEYCGVWRDSTGAAGERRLRSSQGLQQEFSHQVSGEPLSRLLFWENSASCEFYQLMEGFSLENKPFSPRWGGRRKWALFWWHRNVFGFALSSPLSSSLFFLLLLTHK